MKIPVSSLKRSRIPDGSAGRRRFGLEVVEEFLRVSQAFRPLPCFPPAEARAIRRDSLRILTVTQGHSRSPHLRRSLIGKGRHEW